MKNYPFIQPSPPRLSQCVPQLETIEQSGLFSNFGPVNTRFEQDLTAQMFGGVGGCVTVCNATLGLILAMKQVTEGGDPKRRYALMPSFTFAAAAQAALWCGLTPLFCDIDPGTWAADAAAEEALLERFAGEIAVVAPYATFGYDIDLARYERMWKKHGTPVVIDAAASLGSVVSRGGLNFGTGFPGIVVFSMHATKAFATGEGGVMYSADQARLNDLRAMCNFGFGRPRTATLPGLNAKLSEVGALQAQRRLAEFQRVIRHRATLMKEYRRLLPEVTFQAGDLSHQAHQFAPVLLPRALAPLRNELVARMKAQGVGIAHYFSPHVAEQDYFIGRSPPTDLRVTEDVAARSVSLPVNDGLSEDDIVEIATRFRRELRRLGQENGVDFDQTEAVWPKTDAGARHTASSAS
jgi:dTDP-4-amino-4,6-dideoxygalactose transaminase